MKRERKTISGLDRVIRLRLRAISGKTKMTQSEVARALGAVYARIQKYEYGENRVSLSTALKMATLFDCKATDFLPEGTANDGKVKLWSNKTMKIADIVGGLKDADTNLIFQFAKRLAPSKQINASSVH